MAHKYRSQTHCKRYRPAPHGVLKSLAAELSQCKLSVYGRGVTSQSPVRCRLTEGSVIWQEKMSDKLQFVVSSDKGELEDLRSGENSVFRRHDSLVPKLQVIERRFDVYE